jgi:hypothetical protein
MRFLIHGAVRPQNAATLARREHVCHALPELLADPDVPANAGDDPAILLACLDRKQWHLLTTDAALVRDVYEKKIDFRGVIVLVLDDPDASQDQEPPLERLFLRYKRLTPGRLYTVTANRVKIRQLPGAAQRYP